MLMLMTQMQYNYITSGIGFKCPLLSYFASSQSQRLYPHLSPPHGNGLLKKV